MVERLVGEISYDPQFRNLYLAVREQKLEDGWTIGIVIAMGTDESQVRHAIFEDRLVNSERYHLFKPIFARGGRVGEIIGGEET